MFRSGASAQRHATRNMKLLKKKRKFKCKMRKGEGEEVLGAICISAGKIFLDNLRITFLRVHSKNVLEITHFLSEP